jgi:nucleotide-binding universal stress UspA family protein
MKDNKFLLVITGRDTLAASSLSPLLHMAHLQKANLDILLVSEPVPSKYQHLHDSYIQAQKDILQKAIHAFEAENNCTLMGGITAITGKPYIKHVIQFLNDNPDYSLIVKQAETLHNGAKGYAPIDVSFIRKIHYPILFLNQDNDYCDSDADQNIFVAIDPEADSDELKQLNEKLLSQADNCAMANGSRLKIISCWSVEHENFLRDSVFSNISEDEIENIIRNAEAAHRKSLDNFLKEIKILSPYDVIIEKGKADKVIPSILNAEDDALLIMGTTGRSGLSGFLIGNTAENILRQIDCSLLTICPDR